MLDSGYSTDETRSLRDVSDNTLDFSRRLSISITGTAASRQHKRPKGRKDGIIQSRISRHSYGVRQWVKGAGSQIQAKSIVWIIKQVGVCN
jgi:hypothetical protein